MKLPLFLLTTLTSILLTACATAPPEKLADMPLRSGLSKAELEYYYGKPVRIEPNPSGGENWYYKFVAWEKTPIAETTVTEEFGDRSTTSSIGIQFSQSSDEQPVHLNAEGFVTRPIPRGKIWKK
jgi:hypothetical protein